MKLTEKDVIVYYFLGENITKTPFPLIQWRKHSNFPL